MSVVWTLGIFSDDLTPGATQGIMLDVKTSQSWECRDTTHGGVVNGRWVDTDVNTESMGRTLCYNGSGGTVCFRLDSFKPRDWNYNVTGYRIGDTGTGKWNNCWFSVGDKSFTWTIISVRQGGLFTLMTTDDGQEYMAGGGDDSGSSNGWGGDDGSGNVDTQQDAYT
jgi:hypothetical protein